MPYLKINHDDSKLPLEEIELPKDTEGFLEACYKAIGCDCIEVVPTVVRGFYLIIDESGKMKDGWKNRVNILATKLYGSFWDEIVGDAILSRIDHAELVPLTANDIEWIKDNLHLNFC